MVTKPLWVVNLNHAWQAHFARLDDALIFSMIFSLASVL